MRGEVQVRVHHGGRGWRGRTGHRLCALRLDDLCPRQPQEAAGARAEGHDHPAGRRLAGQSNTGQPVARRYRAVAAQLLWLNKHITAISSVITVIELVGFGHVRLM